MPIRDDYEYSYISSAATTTVSGVACKLIRIVVGTTAAGSTIVYNAPTSALSTSGAVGVTLKSSVVEGTYEYGIKLGAGMTIVTAAASLITVVYATA